MKRSCLQVLGKSITHVGGLGDGQIAKAANQIMVAAQMVAMGELLILSQKAGADPKKVVEAIRGGAAGCWTLDNKPQRLFSGNRTPGFKAHMQTKDLNIIVDTARSMESPYLLQDCMLNSMLRCWKWACLNWIIQLLSLLLRNWLAKN